MPAKSTAQVGFIMEHPEKFGGKKKALKEWVEPTKGENLPKHVPKKPSKRMSSRPAPRGR